MAESAEGIGGRKWSLLAVPSESIDEPTALMQGATKLALLTAEGEKVQALLATAPQLWHAANEAVKALGNHSVNVGNHAAAAVDRLADMVAKAVGKDRWEDVAQ